MREINNDSITEIAQRVAELIHEPWNAALPDPWAVSYYRLEHDRRLWFDGVVDLSILDIERQILLYNIEDKDVPVQDRKPIWIYIMNFGGDLDCAWSLIDIISASETPVHTVNVGTCASAAALIFLAGHKRFMLGRSTVLIHEGSASFSGDSAKVLDASDSYKATLKRMHAYIVSRTQIPPATLSKKKNNDWELDSELCLKYGVCNAVANKLSEVIL